MIVCGVDYSLTSPAITVHNGDEWSVNNCKFYYIVGKESLVVTDETFTGYVYQKYESDPHRYDNIAEWSMNIMFKNKVEKMFIEGYAFGAVGRVFQIAENAGLLKYKTWKAGIPYSIFAPSEIKKHATGKGNSNKEKMYEAFLAETSVDIREKLNIIKPTQWNPLSDIVDSYYIAKLGFMKERENANHT
jgi:Holliday junction resolvasome RuvABC endonuclease subunit